MPSASPTNSTSARRHSGFLRDAGLRGVDFFFLAASTAAQIRTAPLWALRTRNRLMHDGLSFSKQEAIQRHAGQAAPVTARYDALTTEQRAALLAFLDSL
jgi:CxxC motif-containing protein (DUF1111 family)